MHIRPSWVFWLRLEPAAPATDGQARQGATEVERAGVTHENLGG